MYESEVPEGWSRLEEMEMVAHDDYGNSEIVESIVAKMGYGMGSYQPKGSDYVPVDDMEEGELLAIPLFAMEIETQDGKEHNFSVLIEMGVYLFGALGDWLFMLHENKECTEEVCPWHR